MAIYTPRKTPLWHEASGNIRLPVTSGGWCNGTRVFEQVASLAKFRRMVEKHSPGADSTQVFLDGVTAAIEIGAMQPGHWFHAFQSLKDWKTLSASLIIGGPLWISERQRNAFHTVSIAAHSIGYNHRPALFNNLAELGAWLKASDWANVEDDSDRFQGRAFMTDRAMGKLVTESRRMMAERVALLTPPEPRPPAKPLRLVISK